MKKTINGMMALVLAAILTGAIALSFTGCPEPDNGPGKPEPVSDLFQLVWQGSRSTAPAGAQDGWVYYNTEDGKLWVSLSGVWQELVITALPGEQGPEGPIGPVGPQGPQGSSGITWLGDLPALPDTAEEGSLCTVSGRAYIRLDGEWILFAKDGAPGQKGDPAVIETEIINGVLWINDMPIGTVGGDTMRLVIFRTGGGYFNDSDEALLLVPFNSIITPPVSLFKFDNWGDPLAVEGWYLDSGLTIPWDFAADRVDNSVTLYPKWVPAYRVRFYDWYGNSSSLYVPQDSAVARPDDPPAIPGITFDGWRTRVMDYDLWEYIYTPYDFDDPVTGNIDLYAFYTGNTYTVSFNANGGSGTMSSVSFTNGEDTLPLNTFAKDGYIFAGWALSQDAEYAEFGNGGYAFFEDEGDTVTLYAVWTVTVPLAADTWQDGYIASGGEQWFEFTATANNQFIYFNPGDSYYAQVELYSSALYNIGGNHFYGNSEWQVNVTAGQTYYIKVKHLFGSGGDYQIAVNDSPTRPELPPVTVPGANLTAKLNSINSNSSGNFIIEVDANESIASWGLYAASGSTITLKGIGTERIISLSGTGSLFIVNSGITLILDENITLQGHADNNSPLVYVYGHLIMNEGSKIIGNKNGGGSSPSYGYGSGVYVQGAFTMNGGEISGNASEREGGGVFVRSNGVFTMNGGKINGNTAEASGGGVGMFEGNLTMTGGEISGNTAAGGGGGVCAYRGTIAMDGGKISGNTSGYGGGVFTETNSIFTMTGGEISGNTAESNGGGVSAWHTVFTMTGGSIGGNTANSGGGVFLYLYYDLFEKTGGTIYGSDGGANSNIVIGSGSNLGVAVNNNSNRGRETTAGPSVNLSTDGFSQSGDWEW